MACEGFERRAKKDLELRALVFCSAVLLAEFSVKCVYTKLRNYLQSRRCDHSNAEIRVQLIEYIYSKVGLVWEVTD
jgi:hypothetical protein